MVMIPYQRGVKMYYDNPNPFGRDPYRDLMCSDARRTFSRFHFGLCAYIASAYLITIIADIVLFFILGDSYIALTENIYYQWLMGVFPMYAVGLPIMYIIVRSMPKKDLPKSKLKLEEFIILFAIAQAFMLIGNTIGTTLNAFFAEIKGEEISNSTSELIENSPMWITVLVAVIIGPIIEEFIFRKLMIDRLSRYGVGITIFISGFSFGLFHGNFYQFFYAALLGMLLAFITLKTGNWLYSVIMHVIINFLGSVAVMPIIEMADELAVFEEALMAGESVDIRRMILCSTAVLSYSVIEYGFVIAGVALLIVAFKNKWYKSR